MSDILPRDPMAIWSEFQETDPAFTKKSDYGAKLTSINGVYQFKKMTQQFGPCGIGWGFEIQESYFDETGPLYAREYDPTARKAVMIMPPTEIGKGRLHTMRIQLWYSPEAALPEVSSAAQTGEWTESSDGQPRPKYTIDGIGHTPYIFMNQSDLFPNVDDEYYKKSLTDALTNAMAKLGMSADVRMGMFDDQEYLQGLQNDKLIERADDQDAEIARQRHEFEDWFKAHLQLIRESTTIRPLEILYKGGRPRVERDGTEDQQKQHFDLKNTTIRRINKPRGDEDESK